MSIRKFWQDNQEIIKFILIVFLFWQFTIASLIFLGEKFIPPGQQLFWSRVNLGDTQHLFIAWFSHFLALYFFYKLIILDWKEKIAKRSILYLLFFPTAFFFSMFYTESLFLFLILASFFFARSKKWLLAGIFGGLATVTRLTGIFLLPAFLTELKQQKKSKGHRPFIIDHWSLCLIPLALLFYRHLLPLDRQNLLEFLPENKVILLYQVFWRYFKMLWTVQKNSLTYFVVVLEFLTGAGFLAALIISYLKKIRLSYLIFAGLAYIVPTLVGNFSSLPRYVLVCFPCFISMALIKNRVCRF
jgi:Gpi18-like mannosyltransferase